ncbi:hypothetical protein ACFOLD_16890 [Kocuria carniphila]
MTRFSSWDSPVFGSLPLTPADDAVAPWPGDVFVAHEDLLLQGGAVHNPR